MFAHLPAIKFMLVTVYTHSATSCSSTIEAKLLCSLSFLKIDFDNNNEAVLTHQHQECDSWKRILWTMLQKPHLCSNEYWRIFTSSCRIIYLSYTRHNREVLERVL